jgi:hypothetical protein
MRSLCYAASGMSKGRKDAAPIPPLWVTGHSLGSALASLIYACYLYMPSNLGEGIQLRDCYTFGSELRSHSTCFSAITTDLELSTAPCLGDGTFVSKYEEVSSQQSIVMQKKIQLTWAPVTTRIKRTWFPLVATSRTVTQHPSHSSSPQEPLLNTR